jgi:hypothetical protein
MAERVDRLESLESIRQLPYRYALALDSRNLDDLVDLFVADVPVGRNERGRAALWAWYDRAMRLPRTSVHTVANHVIDFDDADHARNIVYCRDELERPDAGEWEVGQLQYWDSYVRVDGEWCFARRRFLRWYLVDWHQRPSPGAGVNDGRDPLKAAVLPDAFPSWGEFWSRTPA